MRRAARGALQVLAASVVLSGCSGPSEPAATSETTPSRETTSSSTSLPSSSTQVPPADEPSRTTGGNDAAMTQEPSSPASPTWDRQGRREAVQAAKGVLVVFARPEISQGQWWRDLGPTLTPSARPLYASVDVRNVLVSTVVGQGRLVDDSSPYLATVEFKTDAGTYSVLMARTGQDSPWLAERIEPKRPS